jgi:hypothetical protein
VVGAQGIQGIAGPTGSAGVQGATGSAGVQGEAGPAGPAGQRVVYDSDFQGDGLVWSSDNPTTAFYVQNGNLIFFQITVDLRSVTNFGSGNYLVLLPFAPSSNVVFRNGYILDTDKSKMYAVSAYANPLTSTQAFFFYANGTEDKVVEPNQPLGLNRDDFFYISGTYEIKN